MNPEQAVFLLHFLKGSHDFEMPVTAKVLGAVPEDQKGFKLDGKSKTAVEIAYHIANAEAWFLKSVLAGEFPMEAESVPEGTTIASIVENYNATVPGLWAQVPAMSPEKLATPLNFFGMFNMPAVACLNFMLNHTIHHRGQLAAGLRPMGSKVPSIYGGSADEPLKM